jgi:nicotinate-nucleotide adenylyltransferase
MKKRIGIFGGTFDPVHLGHLSIARDAQAFAQLDEVLFVPNVASPFKLDARPAEAEHRVEMLRLALADQPDFHLSELELERGGVSYSIDTVEALRAEDPERALFFIIGADSLVDLHRWRRPYELLEACTFIVLARPGFELRPADISLDPPWSERLIGNLCTVHLVDISSTEVRAKAAQGKPLKALVPPAVEAYIERCQLYQQPPKEP